MKENAVLVQQSAWFNPMFFDGLEIDYLCFYHSTTGEKIWGEDRPRWFGSNNEYKAIYLPFPVVRATKPNLIRKEAHYVRGGGKIIIYIPTELMPDFACEGEKLTFASDTDDHYQTGYGFTCEAEKKDYELDPNDPDKLLHIVTPRQPHQFFFQSYYRVVPNAFGQEADRIVAAAKSVQVDISRYDIERLTKVLNITLK